jgi:hypothetical protein
MQKFELHKIENCPACLQFIRLARSRKQPKLSFDEYEKLRKACSDFFFKSHPEIQRHLITSWGYAQNIRSQLDKYLRLNGIVILPDKKPGSLHDYQLLGKGMARLDSLKRKIKLKEKLKKDSQ